VTWRSLPGEPIVVGQKSRCYSFLAVGQAETALRRGAEISWWRSEQNCWPLSRNQVRRFRKNVVINSAAAGFLETAMPSRPVVILTKDTALHTGPWGVRLADGEVVADSDWESKDGHYRVRLENKWFDVPDNSVITEPNRAGRTMVWPLRIGTAVSIRCFMPGSMT
jgi:hypothetical protein